MIENILILIVGILLGVLIMRTKLSTPIEKVIDNLWKTKISKKDVK